MIQRPGRNGPTRFPPRRGVWRGVTASERFTQAIAGRYAGRMTPWPPLQRAFRGSCLLVASGRGRPGVRVDVTPRVAISLFTMAPGGSAVGTALPLPGSPATARLAERLVLRTERIVAPAWGPAPASRAAITPPQAGAAGGALTPLVVLRPTHRLGNAGVSEEPRPAQPGGSGVEPPFGQAGTGAPAPAAPGVDLARLTDQVIQAIDRRIVAQRERLGRM